MPWMNTTERVAMLVRDLKRPRGMTGYFGTFHS